MFHDPARGSGENRQFSHSTQKIINLLHKVIYLKMRNAVDEVYSTGSLLGTYDSRSIRSQKQTNVSKSENLFCLLPSPTLGSHPTFWAMFSYSFTQKAWKLGQNPVFCSSFDKLLIFDVRSFHTVQFVSLLNCSANFRNSVVDVRPACA